MMTLLATFPPVDCNSPLVPCPDLTPAECEPTGPSPADAAWWAGETRFAPTADDLAEYERWSDRYNHAQWLAEIEASYEHAEAVEMFGHRADIAIES